MLGSETEIQNKNTSAVSLVVLWWSRKLCEVRIFVGDIFFDQLYPSNAFASQLLLYNLKQLLVFSLCSQQLVILPVFPRQFTSLPSWGPFLLLGSKYLGFSFPQKSSLIFLPLSPHLIVYPIQGQNYSYLLHMISSPRYLYLWQL